MRRMRTVLVLHMSKLAYGIGCVVRNEGGSAELFCSQSDSGIGIVSLVGLFEPERLKWESASASASALLRIFSFLNPSEEGWRQVDGLGLFGYLSESCFHFSFVVSE